MAKKTLTYSPEIVDLVLYAGDGSSFKVTVKDPAGAPINLDGSMIAQIRVERDALDPPSAEFSIDLTDAVNGIAVLSLTGDQTQSLVTGDDKFIGVWDLEWTPSGDEPVTICQGKVEAFPDVSR